MIALEPITRIRGTGVYLPGDDIDTDRIIPARFLKCVTFDGLGDHLFQDVRRTEDGSPTDHPLNNPRFRGATIMLTGSNFGCGSSREHAPQSIYRFGFRAIIAESFAEIFFGNSITLGMPCLTAARQDIHAMAAAIEERPTLELDIDIAAAEVRLAGTRFPIHIDAAARDALLGGRWDPIAELIEGKAATDVTVAGLPYLKMTTSTEGEGGER